MRFLLYRAQLEALTVGSTLELRDTKGGSASFLKNEDGSLTVTLQGGSAGVDVSAPLAAGQTVTMIGGGGGGGGTAITERERFKVGSVWVWTGDGQRDKRWRLRVEALSGAPFRPDILASGLWIEGSSARCPVGSAGAIMINEWARGEWIFEGPFK